MISTEAIHPGHGASSLEHLPPHLHLIISTRSVHPFPLARLRVSGRCLSCGQPICILVAGGDRRFLLPGGWGCALGQGSHSARSEAHGELGGGTATGGTVAARWPAERPDVLQSINGGQRSLVGILGRRCAGTVAGAGPAISLAYLFWSSWRAGSRGVSDQPVEETLAYTPGEPLSPRPSMSPTAGARERGMLVRAVAHARAAPVGHRRHRRESRNGTLESRGDTKMVMAWVGSAASSPGSPRASPLSLLHVGFRWVQWSRCCRR